MIYRAYVGREATLDGATLTLAIMGPGYTPSIDDPDLAAIAAYEISTDDAPGYTREVFEASWDPLAIRLDVADESRIAAVLGLAGATVATYVVADADGVLVASVTLTAPAAGFDDYPVSFPNGIVTFPDLLELLARLSAVEAAVAGGAGLPDQRGHGGEYLRTNGSTASWAAISGGSGGGAAVVGAVLAADAVDGTGNQFTGLLYAPDATGSGIVPDKFEAIDGFTDLDAATLAMFLGFLFPDGANLLVYSAGSWSVRFVNPAAITDPWAAVPAGFVTGATTGVVVDGALTVVSADLIPFQGYALMGSLSNAAAALHGVGRYLDDERHVSTVFAGAVPDLSTLMAGPVDDVDQPTGDDGRQVQKGDLVATLGDVDGDGNGWIHIVDIDTGQWGLVPATGASTPVGAAGWANAISTNALVGGAKIVLASGVVGVYRVHRTNGTDTWVRGGPSVFSDDPPDSGEWVFTPEGGGSGTVDVVSNVASGRLLGRTTAGSGDSEELTPAGARTLLDVYDATTVDAALAGKVPTSRQVAGSALTDDISASTLRSSLGVVNRTAYSLGSLTGTVGIDLANGTSQYGTLTGSTTFTMTGFDASGTECEFVLGVVQDSTPRAITWPAAVKWPNGAAPALSTASGARDVFVFRTRDGGTTVDGFLVGRGMA